MDIVKYQELILDAIDQLRHRKARPDAERIYNCLFRRHSISCTDARIALERCVEHGVVLRVCYKGNISYRNAAKKFSHLKRGPHGELIRMPGRPLRKFPGLLTNTFAELVMRDPDYLSQGVPPHELIKTILAKDSVRYTRRYVTILLQKEVESGGLERLDTGNYIVGPNQTDRRQQVPTENLSTETRKFEPSAHKYKRSHPGSEPKKDSHMEPHKSEGKSGDSLRVGGRRKKAKKVFDPSDNNLPRKRGRPVGSLNKTTLEKQKVDEEEEEPFTDQNGRENGGVCSVCHEKKVDRMVSCRECSNKAHSTCLTKGDMMLRMYPDNTWQCPQCKACVVCYETSGAGSLIVCSVCSDSYHRTCHQPNVRSEKAKNSPKWKCSNCQSPEQLAVDRIQIGYNLETAKLSIANVEEDESPSPALTRNSSPARSTSMTPSPTPPTLSPQIMQNGRQPSPTYSDSKSDMSSLKDERIDITIPDATNWSPEEVYRYFLEYFPEEAFVFKEQEIDGHSLLLMKRMDVLKGLALKLGPALKIYRHVLKLQYRRDDPKLYWV